MKPDCRECRHAYAGADGAQRCRVHRDGLKCSLAAAEGCKRFERKPDTQAAESPAHRVWFDDCDWMGRGD